ncbi:hypothetical protein FIU45_03960 [Enterococcus faecium]|nr:hypothetical protein FIU45_03960 [Enterococcus faecium]
MVHSDSDLILHNSSVLIDKEPKKLEADEHLLICFKSHLDFLLFYNFSSIPVFYNFSSIPV